MLAAAMVDVVPKSIFSVNATACGMVLNAAFANVLTIAMQMAFATMEHANVNLDIGDVLVL